MIEQDTQPVSSNPRGCASLVAWRTFLRSLFTTFVIGIIAIGLLVIYLVGKITGLY